MRLDKGEMAGASVPLFFIFIALVVAFVILAGPDSRDLHSKWPESAEFSQLMTGQTRFSVHDTNLDGWRVLVDHRTGVQYLVTSTGLCPLLDVDGSPLRVLEASDDGE